MVAELLGELASEGHVHDKRPPPSQDAAAGFRFGFGTEQARHGLDTSWSVWRALLVPQANSRPRCRCGLSTLSAALWATAGGTGASTPLAPNRFHSCRPSTVTTCWDRSQLRAMSTICRGRMTNPAQTRVPLLLLSAKTSSVRRVTQNARSRLAAAAAAVAAAAAAAAAAAKNSTKSLPSAAVPAVDSGQSWRQWQAVQRVVLRTA